MRSRYVLDACALIAYINDEDGSDDVDKLLSAALSGDIELKMGKINLLEVYYGIFRVFGIEQAENMFNEIRSQPIQIISDIPDGVFREAGRLKATYKISLADALVLGFTSSSGDTLVTADHHEMDTVERNESIKFFWIR
jgi:predicted nucleic acid-binding protein